MAAATAAAVSRLWQTRAQSPLDAATAYTQLTQRPAWAVGRVVDAVSALCTYAAECSVAVGRFGQKRSKIATSFLHNNHQYRSQANY
ncbi:hypothetical protein GW17_00048190 [Ensete ventricosum]|nr:hypothetical protein GW17_00048190 [Ensete ventricosum]